jgi:acetyl-CoA acyltransferase
MQIGRSASILAGLPITVPGYSIDRWCAGAMTSVTTTASAIGIGAYDVALAGGVEHMGHHPMGEGMDPNPRYLAERLVDPSAMNMGITAEKIHDRFPHLTKERSDAYAVASQQKAAKAYQDGKIQKDLIPVSAGGPEGWNLVTQDELLRPESTLEGMKDLKTPFRPHGKVTAGNASPLTDGATMSLIAGEDAVKKYGLKPKMKMVSFAFAGVEPELMGIGPIPATEKALEKAGLSLSDIGLIEINEAFAIQVLSFLDHFGLADDDPRVNPWGGAIAMGHPLASSGVRLMNQLARHFEQHTDVRYGMTTMCIGLGMGGTVIWENTNYRGK